MTLPSSGYQLMTITNPSSSLTDFPLLFRIDSTATDFWFDNDSSDKTKARAATEAGTELPVHVVHFDQASELAIYAVKANVANTGTQRFRIYPPKAANASYSASDTFGSQNVYDSDTKAALRYSEDLTDSTANAHNSSIGGGTPSVVTDGEYGGALDLADNEYLTDSFGAGDGISGANYISMLIYPTALTGERVFFGSASGAELVLRSDTGNAKLQVIYNSFTSNDRVTGATDLVVNQWQHIAAEYDGSAINIYVNGSLDGTINPTGEWAGEENFNIGTFDGLLDRDFFGQAAYVSVSDSSRGAAWAATESAQALDNGSFITASAWNSGAVAPSISSVSNSELNGSGTISGSGFTGTTTVTISGVNAASFTVDSDTQISYTWPETVGASINSLVDAVVTTAGGSDSFDVTLNTDANTQYVIFGTIDPDSIIGSGFAGFETGDNLILPLTADGRPIVADSDGNISVSGPNASYTFEFDALDASDSYVRTNGFELTISSSGEVPTISLRGISNTSVEALIHFEVGQSVEFNVER